MRNQMRILLILTTALALTGCGIGKDKVLFMTKTNAGLDMDTTPPTAEITIGRKEVVIAPSFEDGKTPPVYASFSFDTDGIVPSFKSNLSSEFAGGNAAVFVTALSNSNAEFGALSIPKGAQNLSGTAHINNVEKLDKLMNGDLCLIEEPKADLVEDSNSRPFFFATDTSIGLKAFLTGTTDFAPTRVTFGYNRKEMALAPVFGREDACQLEVGKDSKKGTYKVNIPSFLATLGNASDVDAKGNVGTGHTQFFATGLAAENLAFNKQTRDKILGGVADGSTGTYGTTADAACIKAWADSDATGKRSTDLNNWLFANYKLRKTDIYHNTAHSVPRNAAIQHFSIPPCP